MLSSLLIASTGLRLAFALPAPWGQWWPHQGHGRGSSSGINVQLGPRPYYLVDNMDESGLKDKLEACSEGPFSTSSFAISHRGAPLMFPEHSREGYMAAARMGAGWLADVKSNEF